MNPTEQGELTNWRRHREVQVRTWNESDRARGTHSLETASGGTCQDTERIRPSEGNSPTGDSIGRNKSGHEMNPTERGALTNWRPHRMGQVRTRNESDRARGTHQLETAWEGQVRTWNESDRSRGTHILETASGEVRTRKESDQARGTHILETASGGTSQDTERIRPSEGYSPTGDGIGRDKLGHGKNPTKRGALTNWRRHQEGQVRTRKRSH
jgi:hypothetical protein